MDACIEKTAQMSCDICFGKTINSIGVKHSSQFSIHWNTKNMLKIQNATE